MLEYDIDKIIDAFGERKNQNSQPLTCNYIKYNYFVLFRYIHLSWLSDILYLHFEKHSNSYMHVMFLLSKMIETHSRLLHVSLQTLKCAIAVALVHLYNKYKLLILALKQGNDYDCFLREQNN